MSVSVGLTNTLARRVGRHASVVAMIGTVGWVGGSLAARGMTTWLAALVVFSLSLVVGAIVYALFERLVGQTLEPLSGLAVALREMASRPSDRQITFRRRLGDTDAASPEVADVVRSVKMVLERIDERNVQQAAWLGSVVHDLKTPIAATANTLEVIAGLEAERISEQRDLLKRSSLELRGLAEHVQSVLDSVRLARDDVPLRRTMVNVRQLVDAVATRQQVGPHILVNVVGDAYAEVDAVLLERAIANLVSNAARCARNRVDVAVYPGMLRISDDGPGLSSPLEQLASPFRSDSLVLDGTTIGGGAAGMGLFLTRRALELHGGKLVVERTDGSGTTFLAYFGGGR